MTGPLATAPLPIAMSPPCAAEAGPNTVPIFKYVSSTVAACADPINTAPNPSNTRALPWPLELPFDRPLAVSSTAVHVPVDAFHTVL